MTNKRMKKLLMAKGISRDGANMIQKLRAWDEDGVPWTNAEKAERFFPAGTGNRSTGQEVKGR